MPQTIPRPDKAPRSEARLNELAEARTEESYIRTQLANERTFCAWIRMGLALLVAGFAATPPAGGNGACLAHYPGRCGARCIECGGLHACLLELSKSKELMLIPWDDYGGDRTFPCACIPVLCRRFPAHQCTARHVTSSWNARLDGKAIPAGASALRESAAEYQCFQAKTRRDYHNESHLSLTTDRADIPQVFSLHLNEILLGRSYVLCVS
jgi:hypothetical protein